MEQKNIITLTGVIGKAEIKSFNDKKVARISVAVDHSYKAKDSDEYTKTTSWFSLSVFENKRFPALEEFTSGRRVSIKGRFRNVKYTGADGVERSSCDIVPSDISFVGAGETAQSAAIELVGRVGSVRISEVAGKKVAHVSLCTNHVFKSKDGSFVEESVWHSVTLWEGPKVICIGEIAKGTPLSVKGRIQASQFTAADGSVRTAYEVVAFSCENLANGDMPAEIAGE